MRVGRAVDVGLELDQQAGHQVDRAAELGDFFEVQRHAQVILGGVQPDPGHGVLAGDVVGVVRLVLVPHQGQGDSSWLVLIEKSNEQRLGPNIHHVSALAVGPSETVHPP